MIENILESHTTVIRNRIEKIATPLNIKIKHGDNGMIFIEKGKKQIIKFLYEITYNEKLLI